MWPNFTIGPYSQGLPYIFFPFRVNPFTEEMQNIFHTAAAPENVCIHLKAI